MKGNGSDRAALASDIARVYASDAADRATHAGKQITKALASRSARAESVSAGLASLANYPGVDTVAARRRIGDAVIQAGRYVF